MSIPSDDRAIYNKYRKNLISEIAENAPEPDNAAPAQTPADSNILAILHMLQNVNPVEKSILLSVLSRMNPDEYTNNLSAKSGIIDRVKRTISYMKMIQNDAEVSGDRTMAEQAAFSVNAAESLLKKINSLNISPV